jgi:hypothetical protein
MAGCPGRNSLRRRPSPAEDDPRRRSSPDSLVWIR